MKEMKTFKALQLLQLALSLAKRIWSWKQSHK